MAASDTFATLRLADDSLDPEFVTHIMRQTPQLAARKGERLYPRSLSKALAKTGTWFVSTERFEDRTADGHLAAAYDMLSSHVAELKQAYPNLDVTFTLLADEASPVSEPLADMVSELGRLERVSHDGV